MKKIILLFFILLSDILTKYWANIADPDFSVLGNILEITHIKNTGVAFGTPLPGISYIIPLILVGLSAYVIRGLRQMKEIERIGYLMIITGGFLNAIERMIFGSVTDFISLQYFAVFNIADVSITVGVILLFWELFNEKKK